MKHQALFIFFLFFSILSSAQTAIIRGKVIDGATNEAVPFAAVVVQGTTTGANTDLDGLFEIKNLSPGLYNLECMATGFNKAVRFEVEVTNDRPANIEFRLDPIIIETKEIEIVASSISNVEESPVSVRTIGTNEIKRNPGGNRDISRAIRSLPGVAAIPSFRNDIIIRGGAANENRFYIDGIEIPNINHFATQGASGGPVGLINVDLIQEVEYYSGAFPAARGNALSSVLEFDFKEARRDKYAANFIVGSSDLGVTVEGPTGERSGLVMSARRSYLQGLFSILGLPFLPTYNDLNAKWDVQVNEKNRLTIIALGAYDQFDLNLNLKTDSTSEDFILNKYLLENLVINEQWNYTVGAKWDHYTDLGKWSYIISRNALQNNAFKYTDNDESLPKTFDYSSRETENKARIEHKRNFANGLKLTMGVSAEWAEYLLSNEAYVFNSILDSTFRVSQKSGFDIPKYGFFIQSSKSFLENKIVLSAGLRGDGTTYNDRMANPLNQLSPRLSVKYRLNKKWSLNANTGVYYQLPQYTILGYEEEGILQNKQANYIRNTQAVMGVQYDWDERNTVITVEGFYKNYNNYAVSNNKGVSLANLGADFGVIGNERIDFIGLGRAYGLEVLYQQRFFEGFYGILAYTFVRSEFTGANNVWAPSSWDSRHLVSLTGGKKFKNNWEVGGRFQFSGGLPYTPDNVASSMLISNWDKFGVAQSDWSKLNSTRIEAFHQLDIRVDKKWFFEKWSLDVFLDIQNIYNKVTLLKPILDVKRDSQGNPIVDANDPTRYVPNFLENTNGTLLPSIGIIVEL
ncbi:MAG: TonB-dependent receptor [Flavobacteriales bacterium]